VELPGLENWGLLFAPIATEERLRGSRDTPRIEGDSKDQKRLLRSRDIPGIKKDSGNQKRDSGDQKRDSGDQKAVP